MGYLQNSVHITCLGSIHNFVYTFTQYNTQMYAILVNIYFSAQQSVTFFIGNYAEYYVETFEKKSRG